ncbi:hypothetical protein L226DRAFT_574923 [Lentinus tigrinus ALCF2SS1-7]|uniref:uncharacterized protein n=1 Tax=Lentinus tigrinus ALCF2SS1-7 TaxID=1328758 RepID=UPI001165DFCD|nr:hypothetical protein L226DRAFT_574923 [Lentinus tigrinus ALCF2SS1-7]
MRSSEDNGSPEHPSPIQLVDSEFAKDSIPLNAMLNELRSEGTQADLDLPRIVMTGNQSSGKSSVVEAISGISVPRDSGTCTRCPIECRLAPAPDWSCQISIRWEFDEHNKRLNDVREVPFGTRITEKSDVESMLRRAQVAVLDQKTATDHFLTMDDESLKCLLHSKQVARFSRNVVCVALSGPGLANLSFIDLPGIIHNATDDVVEMVRDLIRSYLQGNSLILVVLTMSDDIDNQGAVRLAREADPTGSRTIGVLTKPDTLDPGSTAATTHWLDIIEGRRDNTPQGYYCVRQPNDKQRAQGITAPKAREVEAAFFESTKPWSTSSHRDRFGTSNLIKKMSGLLTKMTRDSLPRMINEVARQIKQCDRELHALPAPVTSDPLLFMMDLVSKFCFEVKERVRGSTTHTTLVQKNNAVYQELKLAIGRTAPAFIPFESSRPCDLSVFVVPDCTGDPRFLEDIKNHIESCVTRELPRHTPYAAKESLIRDFQETWEHSTMSCFEDVQENFKVTLSATMDSSFGRFGALKAVGSAIVMEHFSQCRKKAETMIHYHLYSEKTLLYTQNRHQLDTQREKYLTLYTDAQKTIFNSATPGFKPSPKGSALPPHGQAPAREAPGKTEKPAAQPSFTFFMPWVKDQHKEELELMADVRAYFDIAYERILDDVQRAVDLQFLYAFTDTLQNVMFEQLGLSSPDAQARCASYLAEDPGVAAKRQTILSRKKHFVTAEKTFKKFGRS